MDLLDGLSHRDTAASPADHFDVVAAVADGEDVVLVDTAVVVTRVTFRAASAALVDWYVSRGEWQGRAGGYAIQGRGAALITRIEGDYLNVVGLPVAKLLELSPQLVGSGSG